MAPSPANQSLAPSPTSSPPRSDVPAWLLELQAAEQQRLIQQWHPYSNLLENRQLSTHEDHKSWYSTIKSRVLSRRWHPDRLRVICLDPRTAAREAIALRRSLLPGGRGSEWRRGEYVRTVDPIFQANQQVASAGAEFKVTLSRTVLHSDHQGQLKWLTPGGKERSLPVAIQGCEVSALRLEPTAGGDPVVVLAELPGSDQWRQFCEQLRLQIRSAKHDAAALEHGHQLLAQLRHQVVRLRPASALTAEQINGRTFDAVALHDELLAVEEQATVALAAAGKELILLAPPRQYRW